MADEGGVVAGAGIVVIAVEENLIPDVADAVLRRLHQAEAQILRRELDSVEVSRNVAVGRGHNDRSGVGVLFGLRVKLIFEAHRSSERIGLVKFAGQEVPTLIGLPSASAINYVPLFCVS